MPRVPREAETLAAPVLYGSGKQAYTVVMKKFFVIFCGFVAITIVLGLGAAAGLYYFFGRQLPDYTGIGDYLPAGVTRVLARDGTLIGQLYREKRFPITFEQIPEKLRLAFLAVEDADFYKHEGVNPTAILRAFLMNLQSGRTREGGSTITQQLIKSLLLTPERSYTRKLQEAILAYRLEKHLTKNEILTIYLNHIFLGANAYGVEAAARTYFGKHVHELTWAECALIAGLPAAPSAYNPYRFPDAARDRQKHVLFRLRECNWITEAEHTEALAQSLVYTGLSEGLGSETAWYFEEVRRRLIDLFSEENAKKMGLTLPKYGADAVYELGLTVHTVMNPPQQIAADQSLRKGLEDLSKRQGWLGPVNKIAPEYLTAHIETAKFAPTDLAGGNWAKAIVVKVEDKGAQVRLGQYKGAIDVKDMSWARIPNPEVAGVNAPAVKDARRVLEPGDEIWVSAKPKSGAKPYDPAAVTPAVVIDLALEQRPDVQGALVSIEPQTGDVVALCGGYSFAESQFNRVTQAVRQPGSAFKPIVYSAAMDNGFTAGSIVLDAPVVQLSEN
ncbi:MAG: transglycosylase domain-containing protein, partial [Deltaproteobacteria bacterium]|nr:transglycosylase domain-containing protein [Deltaproteobacteria bacterium]